MSPRLLVTRRLPAAAEDHLRTMFDVTTGADDSPFDPVALRAAMTRFDALCPTLTERIDASVLETPKSRVRVIAGYGAGVDHIDLEAARRVGIVVTNTPDVLTDATADLTILLMLMASRRAGEGERLLRAGGWRGWSPTDLVGRGLSGRVLGLVGFGRIAQATARRARDGFGMTIVYSGRQRAPAETEAAFDATFCRTLDELAACADVVSLHCPGGPATRHLVDAAFLRRMKPDAVLVNTARGTVVDEAALVEALATGEIAAAGLDVYDREPEVHPGLLAQENAVLLPHLGSATIEARNAMGTRVARNLAAFFAGEEPPDRVA